MNNILMDYVCEELEDVERDGLKAGNLDSTEKLISIKKNLLEIEQMEGDGYSMNGGNWNAQGSYADGMSYARGGRGGYSSARRRRDSRGRYSRADGKEGMMDHLREMMGEASTEKEREVIREAMSKMEKA